MLTTSCRHLIQHRITVDGNFHANHFIKNCDPDSASLLDGKAHFPENEKYQKHLNTSAKANSTSKSGGGGDDHIEVRTHTRHIRSAHHSTAETAQKTTCSYLKAVNKQEKKKIKGLDVTGVVNVQCSHCFVLSSVDLQLGEK